jgi:hypothetical protein
MIWRRKKEEVMESRGFEESTSEGGERKGRGEISTLTFTRWDMIALAGFWSFHSIFPSIQW